MFKERFKTHHSAMQEGKKYIRGMAYLNEALQGKNETDTKEKATIYIHIPFCSKICTFCNMRRSLQKPQAVYYKYIIKEMEGYAALPYIQDTVFDAVYFGGGTPTTLGAEALQKILEALEKNFRFTKEVEVTIETTLSELTDEKLEMFSKTIVNRYSIGIQTFDTAGRKQMGRRGDGEFAYRRLKEVRAKTDGIISVDLIYSYSGQSEESLDSDLQQIQESGVDGFSLYSLINLQDTSIDEAQQLEIDTKMFDIIASKMESNGFRFLELTKMVKKDQYKYIMNRHLGAETLPLGAGAGGSIKGLMMMNPIELKEYYEQVENFNERKAMNFDLSYRELTKFKGDIQSLKLPKQEDLYEQQESYQKTLKELLAKGYAVTDGDGYRLTRKGIFWGNSISRLLSTYL